MTASPQVPPRPTRSQQHQKPSPAQGVEVPKIPPRPTSRRRPDRSESPHRDSFAPSPLNEAPSGSIYGSISGSLYSSNSQNASTSSLGLVNRPPSVSLPSIGQEGNEYADLNYEETENPVQEKSQSSPTQTRNVGSDLPLHAPKPSLASSNAKARVATVTRTDSSQAAAVGIGKAVTPVHGDDQEPPLQKLRSRSSFSLTESSVSTERPNSTIVEGDHGIPEIGQRVPMYPDAGDVQAPSPSPFSQNFPAGIGFHNDGTQKPRHHGRTRSGREVFNGPPGSYGMHGHGISSQDRFEKAWYDKHPDALIREGHGQYGPGLNERGEGVLSSEDLNKLVRETASRGSGFGTSPTIVGLPDEQIGYKASEEYASRLASPRPQSATYHNKAHSNHSQSHVESPLRKASFPVNAEGKSEFDESKASHQATRDQSEDALESDTENDDVVHADAPDVRKSKIGGNGYDPPTEDLGPHGGNTESEGGYIEERGYGVPILASDEVAKEPGMEYLQPAVSPAQERRGSNYYAGIDSEVPLSYRSGHRSGSRPASVSNSRSSSRPGSIHGTLPNLSRFTSLDDRDDAHTPLEDVEEYEPLFPDEEKDNKPLTAADRFKRRPDMKRRFPSQDIWEDTPNSLQLQATVSTPELREEPSGSPNETPSAVFEDPARESARKGEVSEADKAQLLPKEERWAKSHFQPHLREEMRRPGLKQRFPSRDIWEDTPDSARLETTVGAAQVEDPTSPLDEGLRAGAIVQTAGRPDPGDGLTEQSREGATTGAAAIEKPSVPPRPMKNKASDGTKDSSTQAMPTLPTRPPQRLRQVPPAEIASRPSKPTNNSPTETRQISPTEARKIPSLPDRPKSQVPARPSKPPARDSSESTPLSKTTSTTSDTSNGLGDASLPKSITSPPPAPKPKPALPARPAGGKIAALKAGFLSDLNKSLQLGPHPPPKPQEQAPIEEDQQQEKAPLTDARKGRAKGPARRKPAVSPAAAVKTGEEAGVSKAVLSIAEPWTVWQIVEDDAVHVSSPTQAKETKMETSPLPPHAAQSSTEASQSLDDTQEGKATKVAEPDPPLATKEAEIGPPFTQADGAVDSPTVTEENDELAVESAAVVPSESDPAAEAKPSESPAEPATPIIASEASQTGEKAITLSSGEKMTAYEGGSAIGAGNGNVLVREPLEEQGGDEAEE